MNLKSYFLFIFKIRMGNIHIVLHAICPCEHNLVNKNIAICRGWNIHTDFTYFPTKF
jgi:hypothetical protein